MRACARACVCACVSWLFQRPPGVPRRCQVSRSHGSYVSLRSDEGRAARSPGACQRLLARCLPAGQPVGRCPGEAGRR
eukprot:6218470-Alexandrium_andersonii.AAC.1